MRPPPGRLLRWVARLLVHGPGAPFVLGDLDEATLRDLQRGMSAGRARWRYLKNVLASALSLARTRPRRRSPPVLPPSGQPTGRGPRLSLLDFKLGLRMLIRYPGLTAVAGVAMAFAIALGAGVAEFLKGGLFPTLPLDEGDRVVRLLVRDTRAGGQVPVDPADLAEWRNAMKGVRDLGGFYGLDLVLALGDGAAVPTRGLAVSASAFDVARTPPLLGRPLTASDEDAEAPAVVVLGHDFWRARFAGDRGVVGRVVRLGDRRATVVGVMPERFEFPFPADLYVPLALEQAAALSGPAGDLPGVVGFGRLAPGVTLEEAAAEAAGLDVGARATPNEREHLTPAVERFAQPFFTISGVATNVFLSIVAVLLVLVMAVVCANVALLLFARAATREGEMAVRTALGASRGRIVLQLFVEALVLAGAATAVGLATASAGLKWVLALMSESEAVPFWVDGSLSGTTVAWAVALALLGAVMAGVTPALQVTRGDLHGKLQRGAARRSGARLGGLWNGIVVGQVALTVIFMPAVLAVGSFWWKLRSAEPGVPADELLVATLVAEGEPERVEAARTRMLERLDAEPWVRGVALADRTWPVWSWSRPIEVEGAADPSAPREDRHSLHMAVTPDFLDVVDGALVGGRWLSREDVAAGAPVVVVDEAFVAHVLGGRNAVGRRVRIGETGDAARAAREGDPDGGWREIVGVVADLGLNPYADLPHRGTVFYPLDPAGASRLAVTVRVAGEPEAYAARLRVLALEVGPPLRLLEPTALDRRMERPATEYAAWFRVAGGAGAIALLLTLAGIYAVLAFTVARRTREIGVRVALGGTPRQVAAAVLSGGVRQVGYGVAAGGAVIPLLLLGIGRLVDPAPDFPPPLQSGAILIGYAALMMAVCLLASIVPLRRALAVEPTEALAADG